MNRDKAREFFSAYAEGSLEPGLRNALEQRLSQDSDLRYEYRSFQETVTELDALRFVRAPVPADLHDRIAAKLDLHLWEEKRKAKPAWSGWLRGLAVGGVATVAVVGGVLAILNHGTGASTASLVDFTPNQLLAAPVDGSDSVKVTYSATAPGDIVVFAGSQTMRNDHLQNGQRWETTLSNPQPNVALFRVTVGGESKIEIAIPGASSHHAKAGEGTIEEFAKGIADTYHVPVILSGHDLGQSVTWKFDGVRVADAAGQVLSSRGFRVDVKHGNALWITEND